MLRIVFCFLVVTALGGCEQKKGPGERYAATGTAQPSAPMAAKPAPAAPTSAPAAAAPAPVAAGPSSAPTSQPVGVPTGAIPDGHPSLSGPIAGTISLDPKLKGLVKAGSVLFIMVRRDEGDGQRGMMLAAKKIPVTGDSTFPLKYSVTQADVMMEGTQLAGMMRLSARVDQDSDALSKTPGDLIGQSAKPVPAGTSSVDFSLTEKL